MPELLASDAITLSATSSASSTSGVLVGHIDTASRCQPTWRRLNGSNGWTSWVDLSTSIATPSDRSPLPIRPTPRSAEPSSTTDLTVYSITGHYRDGGNPPCRTQPVGTRRARTASQSSPLSLRRAHLAPLRQSRQWRFAISFKACRSWATPPSPRTSLSHFSYASTTIAHETSSWRPLVVGR
jgi:hypothetical protein